jgi:NitT/TauT family transport system substrate-binding protein
MKREGELSRRHSQVGAKLTRRSFVAGVGATATTAVLSRPAILRAETALKPLRFGTSAKSIAPLSLNFLIGEGLGFNREQGYQMEFLPVGSDTNAIAALDQGTVDVALNSSTFTMPLYAKEQLPPMLDYFEAVYPSKYSISVLPDSPIKSYEDLAGKKIGVTNLGSSDYPFTRAVLKRIGIDPDKGVSSWIPVGVGVPAAVALQRGQIDALAHNDVGLGQIDAAGIEIRVLPTPDNYPLSGGLFIMARNDSLKEKRELLVAYGRTLAKTAIFINANPEAAAREFLRMYPDMAQRGKDIETSVKAILYPVNRRRTILLPNSPNAKIGSIDEAELRNDAELLGLNFDNYAPLYTNELIDEINDFDAEAVKQQAHDYHT